MDFSNTSSPELPKPLKSTNETNTLHNMTLSSSVNIHSRKTLSEYDIKLPKSKATNNLIEISKSSPNEKFYFCSNSEKHLDDMKNTQKRLTILSQNKKKKNPINSNQEKSQTATNHLENVIPVKNKFHIKLFKKLDHLFQSRQNKKNKICPQTTIMENAKKTYRNIQILSPDLPVGPPKKLRTKTKIELSKKNTYSTKKNLLIIFTRSEKNEVIEE